MSVRYVDHDSGERLRVATGLIDPETHHLAEIPLGSVELRYYCDWIEHPEDEDEAPCGLECNPEYLHRVTVPENPTVRHLCDGHLMVLLRHL